MNEIERKALMLEAATSFYRDINPELRGPDPTRIEAWAKREADRIRGEDLNTCEKISFRRSRADMGVIELIDETGGVWDELNATEAEAAALAKALNLSLEMED